MSRYCPNCEREMEAQDCPSCAIRTYTLARLDLAQDPLIGRSLEGRYRIDAVIGQGGMGTVYRATRLATGGVVAIKLIRGELTANLAAVKRFHREARASSMLSHPHTIRVFDFGQAETGELYMVMEHLSGRLLGAVLREAGALPPAAVVKIAGEMAQSLVEAHEAGLVHRDLKSDNVMLLEAVGKRDFVKVLDFGIAKVVSSESGDSVVTGTGAIVGTPHYMAPELARGERRITTAVDIYAFGVILYELLSGRRPFDADTPLAILLKHVGEPPPELRAEGAPPELLGLVADMMAKDPAGRPTAGEVLGALQEIAAGLPTQTGDVAAAGPATAPRLAAQGGTGPGADRTIVTPGPFGAGGPGTEGDGTGADATGEVVPGGRRRWLPVGVVAALGVAALVWAGVRGSESSTGGAARPEPAAPASRSEPGGEGGGQVMERGAGAPEVAAEVAAEAPVAAPVETAAPVVEEAARAAAQAEAPAEAVAAEAVAAEAVAPASAEDEGAAEQPAQAQPPSPRAEAPAAPPRAKGTKRPPKPAAPAAVAEPAPPAPAEGSPKPAYERLDALEPGNPGEAGPAATPGYERLDL